MPTDGTPASVSAEPTRRSEAAIDRRLSVDAVVFDLLLLAFLGALLLTMPRADSARFLPMLIVIPTLVGTAYQLYVDLTPRRHEDEAVEDEILPPDVRRRQVTFALWLLTYFALAWVTSFLLVIPVALFAIFRFVNRQPMLMSAILATGMWGFIFVLFGLVLGIRF